MKVRQSPEAHMLGFMSSGHASKSYWHLLMTFTHLGASHCMNNAPHVLVCECTHARECTSCPSVYSSPLSLYRRQKAAVGQCIIMSSHINLLWVKQIFVHLVFCTAGVFHEISLKARTSFVRVLNLIDFFFFFLILSTHHASLTGFTRTLVSQLSSGFWSFLFCCLRMQTSLRFQDAWSCFLENSERKRDTVASIQLIQLPKLHMCCLSQQILSAKQACCSTCYVKL